MVEALGDLEHHVEAMLAASHALGDVGLQPDPGGQRLDIGLDVLSPNPPILAA